MPALTASQLRPRIVKVEMPSFGEGAYVMVRPLPVSTVVEMNKRLGSLIEIDRAMEFNREIISTCIVDDEGKPAFSSEEIDGLSLATIKELVGVAMTASGCGVEKKD